MYLLLAQRANILLHYLTTYIKSYIVRVRLSFNVNYLLKSLIVCDDGGTPPFGGRPQSLRVQKGSMSICT